MPTTANMMRFIHRWSSRTVVVVIIFVTCLYLNTLRRVVFKEMGTGVVVKNSDEKKWEGRGLVSSQNTIPRDVIKEFQESVLKPKAWLSIGIPTVCRQRKTYLNTTLWSLLYRGKKDSGHNEIYRQNVKIIVSICDLNKACRKDIRTSLYEQFHDYIKSGVLEVITTPLDYYPSLNNLRRTFNDSNERVKWRSKQNLDYAFLMQHARSKSRYYLQLEDDVLAVPDYIDKIRDFINEIHEDWTMLEFSTIGFIGKCFKTEDLGKLANLLKTFYNEQPCDFLIFHFLKLMLQTKRFIRIPTLFQHNGLVSSLTNLTRDVSDIHFSAFRKKYHGNNPKARIHTSLSTWMSFKPLYAYSTTDNEMFWATTPRVGDTYTLAFEEPQLLARVVVVTGHYRNDNDIIIGAILEAGQNLISASEDGVVCSEFRLLGSFEKGFIDVKIKDRTLTKCLRITVTKPQKTWVIIREIAVFTKS